MRRRENEDSTTLAPLEDFVKLMEGEGEGEEKMKELREIFKSAKCRRCERRHLKKNSTSFFNYRRSDCRLQ